MKAQKCNSKFHQVASLTSIRPIHTRKDYTGLEFTYLKVLNFVGFNFQGVSVYLVEDVFGDKCTISSNTIKRKGFGCRFSTEASVEKSFRLGNIRGHMIDRCYNVSSDNYKNYGGRGIDICDEWLGKVGKYNFIVWAAKNGYASGLTIDRTNNDLGYSPHNCTWMSLKDNSRKTRNSVLTMDKAADIREQFSKLSNGEKSRFFRDIAKDLDCSKITIRQLCYFPKHTWN